MKSGGGSSGRVGLYVGEDWWMFLNTYDDHTPILDISCGSTTVSLSVTDRTVGIPAERLSCLNQELQALRAETSREIAGLRSDVQMLRNQLLSLREIINGLPPAAAIARLDEPGTRSETEAS